MKVANSTGQPVDMAEITVFTLNPASHLASLAVANPSSDLVQDLNFTTNDLVIGSTINDTVPIGPKDGNLVLTSTYTNQDGFAQFNITAGIYLINVNKGPSTGYFNVISHLRTGWAETLKLKPYQSPQFESTGPYAVGTIDGITLGGKSANTPIGIQPILLFLGIMFVTVGLILKFTNEKAIRSYRQIS